MSLSKMVDKTICVCYGVLALFTSILQNVFLLFHVEMFVSVYKIDKASFFIGETIFLIWNSCNDPFFGWISDKQYLHGGSYGPEVIGRRLRALSWNGPLLAVAFMSLWFSWTYPAIQFAICLCAYDGFLTMVDLHHSALLADFAVSANARTRLNFYSSLFSAIGAVSVFLSYGMWDRENLLKYQSFCVVLACISAAGFVYVTRRLRKVWTKILKDEELSDIRPLSVEESKASSVAGKAGLRKFIKELAGHTNFHWFAAMNLVQFSVGGVAPNQVHVSYSHIEIQMIQPHRNESLQVFHCHFNSNFFPLFLENLLGDSIPQVICSLILGISFLAPHINNLYFLGLCRRFGVYSVIRGLFVFKLLLSLFMFVMGPNHIWLLCFFIASNRVFTEGTCKLLNLVISDLVDEDFVIHRRQQAVSALIFGTSAFMSKPGQTLAPLIGTWLIAQQTGYDLFQSGNTAKSIKLDLAQLDPTDREAYRLGVFHLLLYIPVVCAILQLIAWANFDLHGKKLRWIKSIRAGVSYATV